MKVIDGGKMERDSDNEFLFRTMYANIIHCAASDYYAGIIEESIFRSILFAASTGDRALLDSLYLELKEVGRL